MPVVRENSIISSRYFLSELPCQIAGDDKNRPLVRTHQVSQAEVLDDDADLDCKSIVWPIRPIYGLYDESDDEATVCYRDRVWLPRVNLSPRRLISS